jgi:hypothetical protein
MKTQILSLFLTLFAMDVFAGTPPPIFNIEFLLGATNFSPNLGLYDPPEERLIRITNQGNVDMSGMLYQFAGTFAIDRANTTCGDTLARNSSCILAIYFTPNATGHFSTPLTVCGAGGVWCSKFSSNFDIKVTNNTIVSTKCDSIQSRPFSALDCQSSYTFANNFKSFIAGVLSPQQPIVSQFYYFQHMPSADETTTNCLDSKQVGVSLDPNITGGGRPLCSLMGLATSNASETDTAAESKLFPPYLYFLLGTSFPLTIPLNDISALSTDFATTTMAPLVRNLGYQGYVDFLKSYYAEQLNKNYANCGGSEVCPSIYYLPYRLTSDQSSLEVWPPRTAYWGSSGGGGSGAGYQIQAFKPGSATHYTLFSGGGGGGGGNTSPEPIVHSDLVDMINTGSGGGGGSQFSNCYYNVTNTNLNGLGLGAGTGFGLSARESADVTYASAPAVDYSYYPPVLYPSWDNATVLTKYTDNLQYLFGILIPNLYNQGYTIAVVGGGGGGTGMEFLMQNGQEYQPHPVSIGYGFNFCYLFNKSNAYSSTDCISSSLTSNSLGATSTDLDTLIYQNLGNFYNKGMDLAVLPANCNGYTNFTCTCKYQSAYVICQLSNLLLANHYTSADIPSWLINPHCNASQQDISAAADLIDTYKQGVGDVLANCKTAVDSFFQANGQTSCQVPWAS